MHHIGLGRTLDGTRIIPLIHSYAIRVIHAATGEIIRTLTINPQRRYHGTGTPTGGLCEFARIITTTSSPVVTVGDAERPGAFPAAIAHSFGRDYPAGTSWAGHPSFAGLRPASKVNQTLPARSNGSGRDDEFFDRNQADEAEVQDGPVCAWLDRLVGPTVDRAPHEGCNDLPIGWHLDSDTDGLDAHRPADDLTVNRGDVQQGDPDIERPGHAGRVSDRVAETPHIGTDIGGRRVVDEMKGADRYTNTEFGRFVTRELWASCRNCR